MNTLLRKTLFAALFLLAAIGASAYDFEYEGGYYNVISSTRLTCEITYKEYHKETETYTGEFIIPETVKYGNDIYKVVRIGDYAFDDCTSLTSVTIPEGVTSIGSSAFSGCRSLTSVTIPEGVTSIGGWAFQFCTSLTSVTIPEGVTSIELWAFSGCSSLASVTIPEGVTSIRTFAFSGCSSLTSVTIPEGVTSIESSAFSDCSSLTSVTIPESVTSIGGFAFAHCSSLTSITIPETVTSISWNPFANCSSLREIIVDDENPDFASIKGVLYSKDITDLYCYPAGLMETSFTIPRTVNSIKNYAFSGCVGLTEIVIPESVTSIGGNSFSECRNLTSLAIPSSVTTIGQNAFSNCSSLTELSIPASVISMYQWPVPGCDGLNSFNIEDCMTPLEIFINGGSFGNDFRELYIGRSIVLNDDSRNDEILVSKNMEKVTFSQFVTSVDDIGMDVAKGLKTVVSRGRIPPTIADDFFSLDQYNNATLYVPKGAMQAYIEAPGWRYFYNIVEGMPTGISQVKSATDRMTVTTDNEYIAISNAHGQVNVYDVSGVLIHSANADGNDLRIAVPGHGMYIVKAGGKTLKVAM